MGRMYAPPARAERAAGGLRRAVAISGIALLLAGCAVTTTAPWGLDLGDYEGDPRTRIAVTSVPANHFVRIGHGGQITQSERKSLDAFVASLARNRPESLRIALYGRVSAAQVSALKSLLIAHGVSPEHIWWGPKPSGYPAVPRGTIAVAAERAIAIAPNCPGAMGHPSAPDDTLTEPNFGCANVANLAAMVADPHHLRQGASSIYYLGQRGAADVDAYRTDKVKELPKTEGFGATAK